MSSPWTEEKASGCLVLADGTVIKGRGFGAEGEAVAEVCFNTAITGYQEILTDPSYAGQIVTFTFPHIGNVGTNEDDLETVDPAQTRAALGCIVKADVTDPANWRSNQHLDAWLKKNNIIGLAAVDTRALTNHIRKNGLANAVIAHHSSGEFDIERLKAEAASWTGLEGRDLAKDVTTDSPHDWDQSTWRLNGGFGTRVSDELNVVVLDYGIKRNILRLLAENGCRIAVLPAESTAEDVLMHNPDGVFLSNGPGDPAATGAYAVPTIKAIIDSGTPTFGICLGHQMMGLALGAKTKKMHQGHHGANHPVKDFVTGKVEITSMNHGFAIDGSTLPENVEETHVSLFDGSNCGLKVKDKPAFSVQHHPEASPGPQDSHYLFTQFVQLMRKTKEEANAGKAAMQKG